MTRFFFAVFVMTSNLTIAQIQRPAADSQAVFNPSLGTVSFEAQSFLHFFAAIDAVIDVDFLKTRYARLPHLGLRLMYATAYRGFEQEGTDLHLGNFVGAAVRASRKGRTSRLDVCLGYGFASELQQNPSSGRFLFYSVEARALTRPAWGSVFFRLMGGAYKPSLPVVVFGVSLGYYE